MALRITHNASALTITRTTDAGGSTSEVSLSPGEVTELIRYLNNLQVLPTSITYRLGAPGAHAL